MATLDDDLTTTATETGFSGVVRVDRPGEPTLVRAFGLADRAHGVPMTPDTRLGVASGSKGFTALAVMSLVDEGVLSLSTTARSLLGTDLPLVADDVTVEHLLAHRSGIGDYLDDDAEPGEYLMPVPVHVLATTEAFVPVLDGHPTLFPAGERFSYCNGGYVLLALLAERASGTSYHDLVRRRVLGPAGMVDTDFLRGDDLPGDAAVGYVEVDGVTRSNVLHLPVLATGDGGAHTTVADMHRFWTALLAGRIVPAATVTTMTAPHSDVPEEGARYGLGFWLDPVGDGIGLVGADAGVSFRSAHSPSTGATWTVVSNTSEGAWPVARVVAAALR
ncbi:serine hydrolase domain-containing protein [Cellulomonas biazotea]|uniref:Serine hydrolase n=1 Tax=Cellulomonas biazotea TaxID=1709 RepID=A0A402DWI9_9CELL|nr:serine hydrolase domain-containing protein [Cellulomonas biazotea]GCE78488.1 serine hydrolase [Cellulomonas biazotea]